jgi:hypothetical protein
LHAAAERLIRACARHTLAVKPAGKTLGGGTSISGGVLFDLDRFHVVSDYSLYDCRIKKDP